ncbi:hypothetical protein [Aminobacter sp. HY435]|uniref:hypothetical protein n=1 Tax=Aminobacter sp. HY435 TaxID=2970917 RepID=UPI0022B9A8F2|nr:hypothetical protein [Aminobacter sp. HY435]
MLAGIPLLIIPFILFNAGLAGLFGAGPASDPWSIEVVSLTMMSGGVFSLSLGDLLVVVALLLFFVEIVKATRTTSASVVDHLLSTFVFVAFLVEFLLVRAAAHSVFFILMVIALLDVLAGFSVSLRSAHRDVTFGRE